MAKLSPLLPPPPTLLVIRETQTPCLFPLSHLLYIILRYLLDAGVTVKNSVHGNLLKEFEELSKSNRDKISNPKNSYHRVNDHERLRSRITFEDNVPKSPVGKLKREKLLNLIQ
ncbi:4-coumarate--CoA ligase-like 9 [Aphis craccivora]|uniref:4-coumarate--CoA ligase-like 9 n=1 Tax=Aphis craccivora TaxID=307492 RepID=A0A6G0ZN01_APHCR|nr:4-coumarate--CoA ligase-like 9 [Aphis craccivora]